LGPRGVPDHRVEAGVEAQVQVAVYTGPCYLVHVSGDSQTLHEQAASSRELVDGWRKLVENKVKKMMATEYLLGGGRHRCVSILYPAERESVSGSVVVLVSLFSWAMLLFVASNCG
jgi:hypothetical protein